MSKLCNGLILLTSLIFSFSFCNVVRANTNCPFYEEFQDRYISQTHFSPDASLESKYFFDDNGNRWLQSIRVFDTYDETHFIKFSLYRGYKVVSEDRLSEWNDFYFDKTRPYHVCLYSIEKPFESISKRMLGYFFETDWLFLPPPFIPIPLSTSLPTGETKGVITLIGPIGEETELYVENPASFGTDYEIEYEKECAICQGELTEENSVTTSCEHEFCDRCLRNWSAKCFALKIRPNCPMCRTDLTSTPSGS